MDRRSRSASRRHPLRIAYSLHRYLLLPGLCLALGVSSVAAPQVASTTGPDQFAAHPYAPHVAEASQRFGIPELWIWAVMRAESQGNSRAVSSAGAMGLMQIMPGTWAMLTERHRLGSDPFDVRANILGGTAYLRAMWDRYGDVRLMLAAYNAGPGRADDYANGRRRLPAETVIAAHFGVTPAVVRQRLKLASVSPRLCEIYADDGMTLEQLMAFTVSDDHARQEQVWEMLAHSYNKSAAYIRQRLTENSVRVADKRVRFVTIDAYVAAGGGVMRDLFEDDDGGWLTDPGLLDTLVADKLRRAGEDIAAEGWKWVATAVDMPWAVTNGHREISGTEVAMTEAEQARFVALQGESDEIEAQWADEHDVPQDVYDRLDAINAEIGKLADRPLVFEPADVAIAGVFVSIERDGSLCVERGYIRPEDEQAADPVPDGTEHELVSVDGDTGSARPVGTDDDGRTGGEDDEEADEGLKPLPDRLVADLTAWRTLALQDALAQNPATAFAAVLHALVLQTCYIASRESCLQLTVQDVSFANPPSGLRDSAPARSLAERARYWEERLPESDADLWDALLALNGDEQAALFAHCASRSVNAQCEIVPKYDNGRVSKHSIERRLAHSHVLARAVGLDPVAAGWRPTVDGYFRSVTKPRILADVTEARGEQFAGMIDHLKKADMAREAERLLEDAQWLPEPLRTPPACEAEPGDMDSDALPAFLENEDGAYAIAAE